MKNQLRTLHSLYQQLSQSSPDWSVRQKQSMTSIIHHARLQDVLPQQLPESYREFLLHTDKPISCEYDRYTLLLFTAEDIKDILCRRMFLDHWGPLAELSFSKKDPSVLFELGLSHWEDTEMEMLDFDNYSIGEEKVPHILRYLGYQNDLFTKPLFPIGTMIDGQEGGLLFLELKTGRVFVQPGGSLFDYADCIEGQEDLFYQPEQLANDIAEFIALFAQKMYPHILEKNGWTLVSPHVEGEQVIEAYGQIGRMQFALCIDPENCDTGAWIDDNRGMSLEHLSHQAAIQLTPDGAKQRFERHQAWSQRFPQISL